MNAITTSIDADLSSGAVSALQMCETWVKV